MRRGEPHGPIFAAFRAIEHASVEALFVRLVATILGADTDRIRAAWEADERSLVVRLERVERMELADLLAARPREARALMADHAHLRRQLVQLRSTLPRLVADAMRNFVHELHAHGQHEKKVFEGPA